MNKQEASDFLGCSLRTLERYMSRGEISFKYEKGKTRDVAVFDEVELHDFKERLEQETIKPAIELRQISTDERSKIAVVNDEVDGLSSIIEFLIKAQSIRPIDKLLLTIADAQQFTGLSRQYLREAIASNHLKAKIIGRAWRIKKADLEAYINAL
jgi:excisionase family DNA binding protein